MKYRLIALLSDLSVTPLYEGKEGRTGDLEHIESRPAENAGSPKQEQSCMATDRPYYSRWACNGFRRSRSDEASVIPIQG